MQEHRRTESVGKRMLEEELYACPKSTPKQ